MSVAAFLRSRVFQNESPKLPRITPAVMASLVLTFFLTACSPKADTTLETGSKTPPPKSATQAEADPLEAMKNAASAGDWGTAGTHLDAVLIRFPANVDALKLAARVAYENGKQDQSTNLILEATKVDSYQDNVLVQQTVVALIGVGRLMDAIELLETAVAKHPDNAQARRLLFDLAMGVDDRPKALMQGRQLVRLRKFDVELLSQLDNGSRRKEENQSFQSMVDRNPTDKRPLTGKARTELDQGDLKKALATANEIVATNPGWIPARMIQGRVLAELKRSDELLKWFQTTNQAEKESPWYWMIRGDAAGQQGDVKAAMGAYLQAIQCDPELLQAWQRAGTLMEQSASSDSGLDAPGLPMIRSQIGLLGQLRQAKEDFLFSGQSSAARAMKVSRILDDLGRLWESEAWAAIATTLPADGSPVAAYRDQLIRKLRNDTPWRIDPNKDLLSKLQKTFPAPEPPQSQQQVAKHISPTDRSTSDVDRFQFAIKPSFQNVAQANGLRFHGKTTDQIEEPGLLLYASAGCGIGVIDFDLDGWPDLHCADAGGQPMQRDSRPNALFRNQTGKFVDVTSASRSGDTGFGQGVCVGDLNEDGFPDVWLANYGPNSILINNGDGTFRDASADLHRVGQGSVTEPRWTTSAAIADFNADGIADVWEVNYCAGLEATTKACEGKPEGPASSVCAPIAFPAETDRLYFGKVDGGFQDVTDQWIDPAKVPGRGLGIIVGRIDADDRIDAFVTNDMTNNHFWIRGENKTGLFSDVGVLRGLAADGRSQPQGSMGIAIGDFDHDKKTDLYVTNFAAEYNTLHSQNRASGFWSDKTNLFGMAGPTIDMVGFGTQAMDMDNDSNLELIVSNGHIDPILDYAQPTHIFQRTSRSEFALLERSMLEGYLAKEHVGRAVAVLDFNRDGRLDLGITHQTEPIALLENQTPSQHHWIRLAVIGRGVSRDAIGANMEIDADGQVIQISKFSGNGYMCTNESVVHVGLANHASKVSVMIDWPGGQKQTHANLDVDCEWVLVEGGKPFRRQ